jgi:hypothetical protein
MTMTAERKAAPEPYEPTSRERQAAESQLARRQQTRPAPRLKVTAKANATEIAPDHPDLGTASLLLMEALGTTSVSFMEELLNQIANASPRDGKTDEGKLNFMLSVIRGVEPRDQLEAMLAAQMAAVHMATMTMARRLACVETIPQQDSAERAFNKLARTYATQIEALKRYRTGGQQKVTVEHVTVNEGGQAIVGNVTHGGRVSRKTEDQPDESERRSITDATGTALQRQVEEDREAVPGAGG